MITPEAPLDAPRGQNGPVVRALDASHMRNRTRIIVLGALAAVAVAAFLLVGTMPGNEALFAYQMRLRIPKICAMLLAAFALGACTMVFQSVVGNRIITPCLLGMNALYMLVHTTVFFFAGSGSFLALNANAAFAVDLAVMAVAGTVVYSRLFRLTHHNVLYILLVGTVLTSLFGSMQSTLVRIMDPNEYETLQATLIPSFSSINTEVVILSLAVLALTSVLLRRDIALLDVVALGHDQATNLGVDYNRTIRRLMVGVVVYIAVATAMVGPISFLGLILANLARQFVKSYRHALLISASVMFGMLVLMAGELVTEQVFHYAVPVSVFITVVGGLYFLHLLLREGD